MPGCRRKKGRFINIKNQVHIYRYFLFPLHFYALAHINSFKYKEEKKYDFQKKASEEMFYFFTNKHLFLNICPVCYFGQLMLILNFACNNFKKLKWKYLKPKFALQSCLKAIFCDKCRTSTNMDILMTVIWHLIINNSVNILLRGNYGLQASLFRFVPPPTPTPLPHPPHPLPPHQS